MKPSQAYKQLKGPEKHAFSSLLNTLLFDVGREILARRYESIKDSIASGIVDETKTLGNSYSYVEVYLRSLVTEVVVVGVSFVINSTNNIPKGLKCAQVNGGKPCGAF